MVTAETVSVTRLSITRAWAVYSCSQDGWNTTLYPQVKGDMLCRCCKSVVKYNTFTVVKTDR